MNAILLGAASLGAFVSIFTGNPSQQVAQAEKLAISQTVGDRGEMKRMTLVDRESAETTEVSVISFAD